MHINNLAIKRATEIAIQKLKMDENCKLSAEERFGIFVKLEEDFFQYRDHVMVYLNLLTVRRTLHIWFERYPGDSLPVLCLRRAIDLLTGEAVPEKNEDVVIFDLFEMIKELFSAKSDYHDIVALFVAQACAVILLQAFEIRRNQDRSHPESVIYQGLLYCIDEDEHDWHYLLNGLPNDVTLWSSGAYCGGMTNEHANIELRKNFWIWWLEDAVFQAWDARTTMASAMSDYLSSIPDVHSSWNDNVLITEIPAYGVIDGFRRSIYDESIPGLYYAVTISPYLDEIRTNGVAWIPFPVYTLYSNGISRYSELISRCFTVFCPEGILIFGNNGKLLYIYVQDVVTTAKVMGIYTGTHPQDGPHNIYIQSDRIGFLKSIKDLMASKNSNEQRKTYVDLIVNSAGYDYFEPPKSTDNLSGGDYEYWNQLSGAILDLDIYIGD